MTDRLPVDLEHEQVGEHGAAEQREEQPEPAEQVQWPVAVPPHEGHRQEVEEPAHVALEPVPRAAVRARPVRDGQLDDPEAVVVGEDGDVPVELAVQPHAARDLRTEGLEAAVHVVQAQPRDPPGDGVEEPGDDAAAQRVAPPGLPP